MIEAAQDRSSGNSMFSSLLLLADDNDDEHLQTDFSTTVSIGYFY